MLYAVLNAYHIRRVWRVLTYFGASSLFLSPETGPMGDSYPFSVPVDPNRLISAQSLIDIQRDHYEGTPYR